ncbi:MAG: hypothetical protein US52_C0006G0027 [candidate division WS6 bacterium GW2011_GWA2_37_6]|uniref:Uncharacterized protein n=1 Tax=candidate division WS6 bacterium GW2011_GWA2_37_6 TaxID=1619087 RepID=A0A0G0H227_9BACT|nr:MAG: hypothetical protein US52_C0006G0027 [candidate division WS6 bacterium GW2011_GWA2_37_6]
MINQSFKPHTFSKLIYVSGSVLLVLQLAATLFRLSSLTHANFELSELRKTEKQMQSQLSYLQSDLAEVRISSFKDSQEFGYVPMRNIVTLSSNLPQVAAR